MWGLLPLVYMYGTIEAQWAEVMGNRDAKFKFFYLFLCKE